MTLHTNHYSSMYATILCKNVAFFEKCVALLHNFRTPPIYVPNQVRNQSIPVGKCKMLFCKIALTFDLLQHGSGKNAILLSKDPSNFAKPLSMKWHIH